MNLLKFLIDRLYFQSRKSLYWKYGVPVYTPLLPWPTLSPLFGLNYNPLEERIH